METKDVILQLRNRENLSQEELAEKLWKTAGSEILSVSLSAF